MAVKHRCILYLNGYESVAPEHYHRRFAREFKRFEATWNVTGKVSECEFSTDNLIARWQTEASGPNWRTRAEYLLLRWDDVVAADRSRPDWKRVPRGLLALLDFIVSGTAFAYFRANPRYFFFFLYPIVLFFALLATGYAAAVVAFDWGLPRYFAAFLGVAVAILLVRFPGRLLYFDYILDDWSFAIDYIRQRTPLEARLEVFARELVARSADRQYDEIIVSGNSLGAALMHDVVARALQINPDLGATGAPIWLMSTGSSLLKVGLHPAATFLRDAVTRVIAQARLSWVEYQALVDVINFYKTNPAQEMRLPDRSKPTVQIVRIRAMLEEATYKRFRGDFFRIHRQFVMGNERRYFYDYFMICCGPLPLKQRVAAPERAVEAFDSDGGYQPGYEGQKP